MEHLQPTVVDSTMNEETKILEIGTTSQNYILPAADVVSGSSTVASPTPSSSATAIGAALPLPPRVATVCGWLTMRHSVSRGLRAALIVADMLGLDRSRLCGTRARSVTMPRFRRIFTMLFIRFCCPWNIYSSVFHLIFIYVCKCDECFST